VRALRFHGPGDLRLEEVPRPEPGHGEVLVQVEVALTDGTDAKAFRRGHPVLLERIPSPFGHEFCGIDVATGRRVVAANSAPCGECPPCRRGDEARCENLRPFLNGAYAEYVLVPERIAERNVLPVPPALAPEVAAMVEPLACGLRGVERAEIDAGQDVAILGPGPMGLMVAAAARDAGARVVVVGGRSERRELARSFGAEPGDGAGADVVVEAAGTEQAWQDAVTLARPGGTVLLFGGLPAETAVPLDAHRLHYEELTVRGSFHHTPRHVRAALAFLASGAYPWELLITHRVGLESVAGLFADPPRDLLKAAVLP
jgi:L-iditol 2-dehydrogenase